MGLIVIVILIVVVLAVISLYNGLVKSRNRVDEAWSDIDVQLKRRHDLIPNLINTVQGYVKHEREVFEKVTEMRAKAINAGNEHDKIEAESGLSGALKSLFAVTENYPELKANQNFLELQRELSDTENKIQASRRFYNGNVRDFNTKIQTFPANLVAGVMGFGKREFFEAEEADKAVPEVKF